MLVFKRLVVWAMTACAIAGSGGAALAGLGQPSLDHHRVILKELVVTGAFNYDANGFEDALRLLASGTLPLDSLLASEDVPLAGIMPAMERLAAGLVGAKLLVVPR